MLRVTILILSLVIFSCNSNKSNSDSQVDSKVSSVADVTKENSTFKFKPGDITKIFCNNFDISEHLISSYYGAFGDNYYRIDLKIDSMVKNSDCKYKVFGETTLKNKTVDFTGEMEITKVEMEATNLYDFDDSTNYETNLFAKYHFNEDSSVDGAGSFKGKFKLLIHLRKDNTIDWNTGEWMGDGYSNYIFDGKWISPEGKHYTSYFGDGKLNIGDLNGGDGEFVPRRKYIKNGWWDFAELYYSSDTALMKEIEQLKTADKH